MCCERLCKQISSAWAELLMIFLTMASLSVPYTIDATLQTETFGPQRFGWSGLFFSIQGVSAFIFSPLLGTLSDFYGRWGSSLAGIIGMSVVPIVTIATLDSKDAYWQYFIMKSTFGSLYGGIFATCAAGLVDKVQAIDEELDHHAAPEDVAGYGGDNNDDRINASQNNNQQQDEQVQDEVSKSLSAKRIDFFGLGVCAFLLGVLTGNVVGQEVSDLKMKFTTELIICLLGVIFATFCLVRERREMAEKQDANDGERTQLVRSDGLPSSSDHNRDNDKNDSDDRHENDHDENDDQKNEHRSSITHVHMANRQQKHPTAMSKMRALICEEQGLVGSALIIFANFLCEQMLGSLLLLYLHSNLGFSTKDQMILIIALCFASLIAIVLLRFLSARNINPIIILRVALICNGVSVALYSIPDLTKWQAFLPIIFCTVSIMSFPSATTVAQQMVDDEDAGAAQGLCAAARFLAEGISPFAFGAMMNAMQGTSWPGAPFLGAGCCCFLAFIGTFFLPKFKRDRQ